MRWCGDRRRALIDDLAGTRAVFNLGAGVDAIPKVPAWPQGVPLVRLEDAGMAEQMAEYATYAVLRRYREFACLRIGTVAPRIGCHGRDRTSAAFGVGVLGMGVLGTASRRRSLALGFPVASWSRAGKDLPG